MTGNLFPARLRASHQDRRITTNFRRNGKLQSCEPCRKGKMRCDHMMPTCGRCARRNKAEQCVYHPAPLTKKALPTPQPTDSEKSTSPTVVLSYESPLFSTVNLPSPARDEVIPQPRVSRASSLPAQNWSSLIYGQRTIEELRRPLPEYQVRVDTLNFEQEAPFVHHAAILAENELNIGIQPPESTPSKIPQSYIDRGATVLTLLKDMPTLQKYINKWFSFARGIIMIEPMVKIYTTSLWSTWHHVLENQKVGDLRTMSEKLWQNTTKPLSRLLKKNTTPTEFCENVTGDNLRWEVVGIIVTLVALLAETLLDGDPIFCSHDEPPVDRAALAVKMHNASEMCVNFCDEFGVLNDLYLWLLHENAVVYCAMRTRGSYENWKKSGTLATALVCCNLHQEIKVDENTPFFITEFRKRLFVCAYSNDKFSASFVGRPPRLTRYYCRLQLPLDLTDAQIMSSGAELDNALGDVDNKGWNRRGLVQRCTFSRVFASNALIMEEILELSLGMLSAEEIIRRAAQIDTIVKANYDELPSFLRMDLEDPWSPNRAPVELLYLAHIKLIRYDHHFLLQRTLVKRAGQDSTALLAVCREMFGFIMEIVNNKDRLRDFQVDFTQIICMDGIPAAAVIAVELLHQWQDPYSASSLTIPLPRSESIQQLSVFVSCLGNIRPESNGYQSGDRGRKFLKKILDTILSPAPAVTIDAGSAGSENPNDPTLTASFLQTGNDGDFMRWLDNMEWDQEGWTNFT